MLKYILYGGQLVCVLGGVALGSWAKSLNGVEPTHEEALTGHDINAEEHHDASRESQAPAQAPKTTAAEHGSDKGKTGAERISSTSGFMKFSRQFVVPVLDTSSGVRSLVVMDINIETPASATESIYAREPNLRDALLSALLKLSNEGAFSEAFLEKRNLDRIRAELLDSARMVIGDNAMDVLILNIIRQDV